VNFQREDFRRGLRADFDDLREAFREGNSCKAEVYRNVRREDRNEEYHETEVDFHSDARKKQTDAIKIKKGENANEQRLL